jgi:hypothetical protein
MIADFLSELSGETQNSKFQHQPGKEMIQSALRRGLFRFGFSLFCAEEPAFVGDFGRTEVWIPT